MCHLRITFIIFLIIASHSTYSYKKSQVSLGIESNSPKAKLYLQLHRFANPSYRLSTGRKCNVFGSNCDPYFIVCVSPLDNPTTCLFLNHRSKPYYGMNIIEGKYWKELAVPFERILSIPIPKSILVSVEVLEYDAIGVFRKPPIAYFAAAVELRPRANGTRAVPNDRRIVLQRLDSPAVNPVTLEVSLEVSCPQNYFGKFCEKMCQPNDQYWCNKDGDKVYLAEATCLSFNACSIQACKNGGRCVLVEENGKATYQCICTEPFSGRTCESTDATNRREWLVRAYMGMFFILFCVTTLALLAVIYCFKYHKVATLGVHHILTRRLASVEAGHPLPRPIVSTLSSFEIYSRLSSNLLRESPRHIRIHDECEESDYLKSNPDHFYCYMSASDVEHSGNGDLYEMKQQLPSPVRSLE